jgi:hypothetical protein
VSDCEWNPSADRPVYAHEERHGPATVNVRGFEGGIHLCDACAALPRFKRFRARRPLTGGR